MYVELKAFCSLETDDLFGSTGQAGSVHHLSVLQDPVIATSRIDSYDGDTVPFHYNRHEDNKYIVETLPAIDFIKRLIRHIPEKYFKMIRYGGLYARRRKTDEKLYRAISKSKHRICRSFNQWRTAILSSFGYDPLECPNCKHKMELLELYYNHKRVSLEELYESNVQIFRKAFFCMISFFMFYDRIL